MKCFAYTSSAEALDPASFPFHGTVPVWKEICCASFFSTKLMSVSYIHGQCKLH